MKQLRPYQISGVERLLEITKKRHSALLADEPGLGKTIQVAEFINRTKPWSVLIVCPASLRINWKHELDIWLTHIPEELTIVSYNLVGRICGTFDLAVFDEAHYLKNSQAKRTEECLEIKADTKLFLTGTPVVNRPSEAFNILKACGMKISRKDYEKRYCNAHLITVPGRKKRKVWDTSGASHIDELNASLRKHIMVRRTKEEVLPELPDKIRQVIELDIWVPESDRMKAFGDSYSSMDNADKALDSTKRIAFTELSEEFLETSMAKVPYVSEFVLQLLQEEEKVVVFAHHRIVIDMLESSFAVNRIRVSKVYGGMSDEQKNRAVEDFQNGDNRVFIGQIQAAGTGLTLTASSTVVFAELDWVPGNIIQAEDRCHRFGQKNPVRVFHIATSDSVDAKMIHAFVKKQEIIEKLTR